MVLGGTSLVGLFVRIDIAGAISCRVADPRTTQEINDDQTGMVAK